MKYTTKVTIDLPLQLVIKKLTNHNNMKHWMRNLISYQVLNGTPYQKDCQTELVFKQGKGQLRMVETIISNNLPHALALRYKANGIYNEQTYTFTSIDDQSCIWQSDTLFKFKSPMLKVLAFIFPSSFKKQSQQYANDFKRFAEEAKSVQEK